jgi:phage terminase large subunit
LSAKIDIYPIPASRREALAPLIEKHPQKWVVFNDAFMQTLFRKERYQLLYGGQGSSKSDTKAQELLIKCLTQKHFRCLYCRKFKSQIKESQFEMFVEIIKRNKWESFFDYSEADNSSLVIRCKLNDNRFTPMGLDQIDKLTSITNFTDVWIEEPLSKKNPNMNVTEKDFFELDRRLRTIKSDLHIHFTFNPVSSNTWIYNFFFDPKHEKFKQYGNANTTYTHKSTFHDNAFVNHAEEEAKLRRQGSYEYRIFALAEWGFIKAETPFFYEFDMDKHVDRLEFNPTKAFILSFDFNLDIMPTTVWQISEDLTKVFCVYEFKPCKGLQDRINQIKSSRFAPYLQNCLITGDATGKNRDQKTPNITNFTFIKEGLNLRAHQIKVASVNMHHTDSRTLCNYVIRNLEFCIDENCTNLIADMQMTEADAAGGIAKKVHDPHWGDTKRYVAQNFLYKHFKSFVK